MLYKKLIQVFIAFSLLVGSGASFSQEVCATYFDGNGNLSFGF